MNNDLLFDFTVDKAAKTVTIVREFAAGQSLVWDAYTRPEILDLWWAPKPLASRTKAMNFEDGGRRFYAMVHPDGTAHWSVQRYSSINPKTHFKIFSAFADKDENLDLPGSYWDLDFSEQNCTTTVTIGIYNESLTRMERMIEMGTIEGFKMQMMNLDELLPTLSQK